MKILFVDDELDRIEQFAQDIEIEASEQGREIPEITKISDLEVAYQHILQYDQFIDIIVLDIMMPGGEDFWKKEDPMGLRCGFYFYQAIRNKFPRLNIVIFTNVDDPEILSVIENDNNTILLFKDETLPFELTSKILSLCMR
jgi:CheY-like chemotaxis protein